ncbi:MAG: spore cortex biosynthesis protein YabQ [Clostridia bacterium]|nr:spore cortex biosynthesis protein YabQ [Clostridia bacterium]MDE7400780.1 spore cortex biosynthesis protein YabQ [Clostridia bacterium]
MQIFIFLTCALCGVISGVVYDILYIARAFVCGLDKAKFTLKDKIFTCICDLIYFIAFSAMFVFTSVCFEFYTIRLYMLIGCALGALIYLKSLHFIIAFLVRRVYNRIRKIKTVRGGKACTKKSATK